MAARRYDCASYLLEMDVEQKPHEGHEEQDEFPSVVSCTERSAMMGEEEDEREADELV